MNDFSILLKNNLYSALRKKWFMTYILGISLVLGVFHFFGLAESHALGFTGLSRLLMIFIQVSILLLPLFTLFTTARNLVRERENGIWEFLLSQPVPLFSFYWAKVVAQIIILFVPFVVVIFLSSTIATFFKYNIDWSISFATLGLVFSNIFYFIGISFLISVLSSSQEMAMSLVFAIWLLFEIMIDALLLGMMLQMRFVSEVIVSLALLNPLQGFRTTSISLFDPDLTVLGPISYNILETFGQQGILMWSLFYPVITGFLFMFIGYRFFLRRDLL